MRSQDIRAARDDLAVFGDLIGWPLAPFQSAALTLVTAMTVLLAPRQTGKSRSLAVLAVWWAFRNRGSQVLIVSASDDAAKRLLATVRQVLAHPLLGGAVLDDTASLVTLSNGSTIRSVPSSERQIRGWTVDLLIVDEAALVSDEVLLGAALPTTAARPDARIVLASTPMQTRGTFHDLYVKGGTDAPHVVSHRWRRSDAWWISASAVELARTAMHPAMFAAEYEGEFMGSLDSYFDPAQILDAVAPYPLVPAAQAQGGTVAVGLDWGNRFDWQAIVLLAQLEDHGVNPGADGVYYLPWIEASRRAYHDQLDTIVGLRRRRPVDPRSLDTSWDGHDGQVRGHIVNRLPGGRILHSDPGSTLRPRRLMQGGTGYDLAAVFSETNGVGAMPTEELARRLRGTSVTAVHSSQATKENAYGRLRVLLSQRRLVLPDDDTLKRQLLGLRCEPTQNGHLRIEASSPSVHDDLADALSLAATGIPTDRVRRTYTPVPDGVDFIETPSGIQVPRHPRPVSGGLLTRAHNYITTYG
jgi:hypothetical protein